MKPRNTKKKRARSFFSKLFFYYLCWRDCTKHFFPLYKTCRDIELLETWTSMVSEWGDSQKAEKANRCQKIDILDEDEYDSEYEENQRKKKMNRDIELW